MNAMQRRGSWLSGAGIVLWLVFTVVLAATPDGGGANIGAGFVALLALALSGLGAALLLTSTRAVAVRATAAGSLAAWLVYLGLAVDDTGPRVLAIAVLVLGVLLLAAATWMTVRSGRRRGAVPR